MLISILSYTHTGVPVGTTDLIRSLHGGTHRYYRDSSDTGVPVGTSELIFVQRYLVSCTCTTEPILVLRIFYLYYRVYFGISDLILVLRSIYMYYRTYTCISDHIHVLQSIYLSYGFYTCFAELIIILRILFLYEGTCRYDKSEQIRIISYTRSDQTSTDTDISPS